MFNRVIKFKNSTISIGTVQTDDALRRELDAFDLANSTPTDCMDFLRHLKEQYGSRSRR